jgi:hypothetical protein
MHRLAAALAFIALIAGSASTNSESLRCPEAVIAGAATVSEAAQITALWRDLGDGVSGSDGPLGCPMKLAEIMSDAGWTGVSQSFQRGWILIGRDGSAGSRLAAVRGLNGWTIWWDGMAAFATASDSAPMLPEKERTQATPANWAHGGTLEVAYPTKPIALWACPRMICATFYEATGFPDRSYWERVTPWMSALERPFDAAARLDEDGLSVPDPAKRAARNDAIFANWLPCYTSLLNVDLAPPSEDTIGRAAVMMKRTAPCPLNGALPSATANQWLMALSFPGDLYPGSTSDDLPCTRKGELDVALVQLLQIVFHYSYAIDTATVDHLRDILQPWGGKPRSDPYVTPNGACLGFGIIETENHILLQESGRYLINMLLAPRGLGADYDNSANADWLLRFMRQIARRDFYEFNAIPYTRYQAKALFALNDQAEPRVATAAKGLLDWLFAKAAISGNLDRDHRPYRRRPEPKRYAATPWWGDPTTATTAEAALIGGSLQHVHEDIDLQFHAGMDDLKQRALTDLAHFPELGAAGENFLTEFIDAADTNYALPSALADWLARRYSDDLANRVTYVQAIHHQSGIADDKTLFAQSNAGVELVSGNRNWTLVAGGIPVAPGDPGAPPQSTVSSLIFGISGATAGAAAGGAIGRNLAGEVGAGFGSVFGWVAGFFGASKTPAEIASDKQHNGLWGDQIGVLRETALIPTPIGLNRSQTLRYGEPELSTEGLPQWARLCVADGFMCGFDLHLPTRPFAAQDVAQCPLQGTLPPALDALTKAPVRAGAGTLASFLRCQLKNPGQQDQWRIWSYEFGTLAIALGDPPGSERIMASWIENEKVAKTRQLHLQWTLPGQSHNWYNAHVYNHAVLPASGGAPGGDFTFQTYGDANNTDTWDHGDLTFTLDGVPDASWNIVVEGCDPTYIAGIIRSGHECHADVLPKLNVTVAPEPAQSFSCDAKADSQVMGMTSIVMEVGSCEQGPFGLFVYIYSDACPRQRGSGCPVGASDFGFVVVAPSRGWKRDEFTGAIASAINQYRTDSGHLYRPSDQAATLAVPMSPPVEKTSGFVEWRPVPGATFSSHVVTFRWPMQDQPSIIADTAYPGLYGVIANPWSGWPMASGGLSTPDVVGAVTGAPFIRNSGDGCFAIPGLATPSNPDPKGLVIDLRDIAAPKIDEPANSQLGMFCL